MKRMITLVLLIAATAISSSAQDVDTVYEYELKNVDVVSSYKWNNDTLRNRYDQMKRNVAIVMPYVLEATALFNEINAKLNSGTLTRRQEKAFIKQKEALVRARVEDKVVKLNTTQGVLLMKLIARQTSLNVYHILDDFKGPVTALKWQAWARYNGFNLNKKYDPAEEPLLELVMGKMGYPLNSVRSVESGVR